MIEKIVNEVKKLLLDYSHHLQQNDKNLIDIELEKISENTKALTDLINKYKLNKNPD